MPVVGQRLSKQRATLFAVASPPECRQCRRPGPWCVRVLRVLFEKHGEVLIPFRFDKERSQNVPRALVVAWIQPQHVTKVIDGFASNTARPQRARQTEPRPHIGPRLQEAPELAHVLLERSPERLLSGFDSATPQIKFLVGTGLGMPGQQHVGIRTQRTDSERLLGKRETALGRARLPGLVHALLRLSERTLHTLRRLSGHPKCLCRPATL